MIKQNHVTSELPELCFSPKFKSWNLWLHASTPRHLPVGAITELLKAMALKKPSGRHPECVWQSRQVLMLSNFQNFPTTAITVEFWMWSVDACRQGTPFSYATGGYNDNDNTFLLFNYQNW